MHQHMYRAKTYLDKESMQKERAPEMREGAASQVNIMRQQYENHPSQEN